MQTGVVWYDIGKSKHQGTMKAQVVSALPCGLLADFIKIPRSSAIQCYNPATGQLLGQVNPATPDGIDRAVARAADAQKEWATTTFRQRRKVLGTMLKYVVLGIGVSSRTTS